MTWRNRSWLGTIALLCGCASAQQPAQSAAADVEQLALPSWADAAQPDAPATQARTYETRTLEAPPEPRTRIEQVLAGRGARRLRTMAFHQAPISEVLRTLAAAASFNLVIADGVPDTKITIELKNVTLQDALAAVLAAGQLEAVAIGNEIVLVRSASKP